MNNRRISTTGALVSGLLLAPWVSRAQDVAPSEGEVTAAQEQCINECIDEQVDSCVATCTETAAPPTKKLKSTRAGAKPAQPAKSAQAPEVEERARAAEEVEATDQAARQAEIDRVREEERATARTMMMEQEERIRTEEREMAAAQTTAAVETARQEERNRLVVEQAEPQGWSPHIADALTTPVGVYAAVGGGVTDFLEPDASGTTGFGGFWDARLGFGSRWILGAEAAYVGGSRDIEALGLNDSAYLVNNGLEGVGRLNIPVTSEKYKVLLEPYGFGGLGWQHYALVNEGTNTSAVADDDDVMTLPMGLGITGGFSGVTLDVRWTYRHTLFSDLLGDSSSSFSDNSLNNWNLGASLGVEL